MCSPDHDCCPLVSPRAFEAGRVVALLTLLPEAPLVHVITRMTGTANHRGFDLVLRSDVAVGATHLRVGAQLGEASVCRVVEVLQQKKKQKKTLGTVFPQVAIVDIRRGV